MKKVIFIFVLISVGVSRTGNSFIEQYPFGKSWENMSGQEQIYKASYDGYLRGVIDGDQIAIMRAKFKIEGNWYNIHSLNTGLSGMSTDQIIRIVKAWCDKHPEQTHNSFAEIIVHALVPLLPPTWDETTPIDE